MRLFIIILILSITTISFGDVYILTDSVTKEVKSVSDQDDAVMEKDWEKTILPGNKKDYPLIYQAKYYKMNGKKFVVNTSKISDEENAKEKKTKKKDEMDLIINKAYKTACEALELENVNFKEINCSDF